jgi:hypothetical protein
MSFRRSLVLLLAGLPTSLAAQESANNTPPTAPQISAQRPATVTCGSKGGARVQCAADTSRGIVLLRSTGDAPCLLGRTWGYDQSSVWVSDGCAAEFATAPAAEPETTQPRAPTYIPNAGFLLVDGSKGQIYFRLFSYGRYLNQRNLDSEYVDAFGNTKTVQRRQDVQLNKFFAPFSGWFLSPKMRYYLYVWSSNPSQGDPAQVVGAGNLTWNFNRGSYTSGVWLKGELHTKVKYHAMFANNLSTLGVSASQLDNRFDTQSYSVQWLPTTGEFGLYGTFGDYDDHQNVATRLATHYTHSLEEKQGQPGTEAIENSQIRLTDGSIVFTPDLFGPGITVNEVDYHMMSVDAGIKYLGVSLEGEVYWRWLRNFTGINTGFIPDINDTGYQVQASAMAVPKILQLYAGASQVFGDHGDPWEVRGGQNWYFLKDRGVRLNGELIYVDQSPVGYTAYPMPVGAKGPVFHVNLEINF